MSGRHFTQSCYDILRFAGELKNAIDSNDSDTQIPYGGTVEFHHPGETIDRLKRAEQIIRVAGHLAMEAEWLYCGDNAPDQFNAAFDEIIARYRRTRFHGHTSQSAF